MKLIDVENYKILAKVGSGTFSEVYRAKRSEDGAMFACKLLKKKITSQEQVNRLREVQALRRLNPNPNILHMEDVIFNAEINQLVIVTELMEVNLYEFIKQCGRQKPTESRVKNIIWQLFKALGHMHKHGIFHRDVKPENILMKGDVIKLADFGSCRGMFSKQPFTEYISTRWYRAPECLITDGYYSHKMDVWAAGCVFYEVATLRPLFPGSNEVDQINKIHEIIGTPTQAILSKFKKSRQMSFDFPKNKGVDLAIMIPDLGAGAADLLRTSLHYDPDSRLTAKEALDHSYLHSERQREKLQRAERRAKRESKAEKRHDSPGSDTDSVRSRKGSFNSRHNSISMRNRTGSFGKKTDVVEPSSRVSKEAKAETGGLQTIEERFPVPPLPLKKKEPTENKTGKAPHEESLRLSEATQKKVEAARANARKWESSSVVETDRSSVQTNRSRFSESNVRLRADKPEMSSYEDMKRLLQSTLNQSQNRTKVTHRTLGGPRRLMKGDGGRSGGILIEAYPPKVVGGKDLLLPRINPANVGISPRSTRDFLQIHQVAKPK